jgi:transposase
MREIVNAILYVLRGGIPWRMLQPCFPPHQTVYGWFAVLRDGGIWKNLNHHMVMLDREWAGCEASPSAAVIDSQSAKTTEADCVRGFDPGKKVLGRKRHALVDTDCRLLVAQVQYPSGECRLTALNLPADLRVRFESFYAQPRRLMSNIVEAA